MDKKRCAAVILAAGSGSRMHSAVPKQFMELEGRPLIWYSLEAVERSSIIDNCESVARALEVLENREPSRGDGYVFIHDGARPFLTEKILEDTYAAVYAYGACVAAVPSKDTVKLADSEGYACQTPNRNSVWLVQTPQVFEERMICEAYRMLMTRLSSLAEQGIEITDDAMVVETMLRRHVKLVPASYENIKVTTPEDMKIAAALLAGRQPYTD